MAGIKDLITQIPPEYRLYLQTMLPGQKTGTIDESYFSLLKKYSNYIKFDGWKPPYHGDVSYPKSKVSWNKLLKDAPNASATLNKFI